MLEYIFINEKSLDNKPTLLLSIQSHANKRLLKKYLSDNYSVNSQPYDFDHISDDLLITDYPTLLRNKDKLAKQKNNINEAILPVLLLIEDNSVLKKDSTIWNFVDDVIEMPVPINILKARIRSLVRLRAYSNRLIKQNEKLRIFEKAINSTEVGVIITDAKNDDRMVFCNDGFTKLTGYSKQEVLGKNCRFLQNGERDEDALKDIHDILNKDVQGATVIKNYRKDGSIFWNELSIAPIKNKAGVTTHNVGIQTDVTELIDIQNRLREERSIHKLVTENSTDMISRHALDGSYIYVTPSCVGVTGYSQKELQGQIAYDLFHPDDIKRIRNAHRKLKNNGDQITVTYRIRTKSDSYKWVETISRLTTNCDNTYSVELQSSTRDISERKNYEQKLEKSLEEKSVLLQEIHHRVKNNLAVISGLLQIQQFESKDEKLNHILGNSISRIKSMALIHEKLYQSDSFSNVDFKDYIASLLDTIMNTMEIRNEIEVTIDCDDVDMSINQAVPCALIINEAVTNSLKHAFINKKDGSILVRFKEDHKNITVTVKDNGVGIPTSIINDYEHTMGMTIINILSSQLQASLDIDNSAGTTIIIQFENKEKFGAYNRHL